MSASATLLMKHPSTGRVESTHRRVRSDLLARPRPGEADVAVLHREIDGDEVCGCSRAGGGQHGGGGGIRAIRSSPDFAASAASDAVSAAASAISSGTAHDRSSFASSSPLTGTSSARAASSASSACCRHLGVGERERRGTGLERQRLSGDAGRVAQESAERLATITTRPAAKATVNADADPLPGVGFPVPSRSRKSPSERSRYSSAGMEKV